ncbi:MAG: hypothetical protein CO127_01935 [Ignavibacteria bacterium CG_4_9_14_3_um_filter_36_18]|nr:MAG: hypothetical protein CO127_01935 [Ignavibacteria bacterium CG_4_9_14_3_um_filter_36_18]
MQQFTIIKDIVIILLVSIPIIFVFNKLKIPSIVGFLAAGMIIGPHGFQLISEITEIEVMAEVGVILLLFVIGLEVSIKQLMRMKKFLIIAGGLQLIGTIAFSSIIFYSFGINITQSIFLAMLVSLSSTAIVLKLLSDKRELEAPHGRIALGVLIFQDLAIVPMFIVLPILGSGSNMPVSEIVLQLFFAFGVVGVVLLASNYLMPRILETLVKMKMREAFTVGILLILLGTAYLTHAVGLSFALGAFIAGLILSESDYSHQIVAEILPLKDAFNSIFFVSIGLLLNIGFVFQFPYLLIGITAGIIVLKAIVVIAIVKFMKYPLRTAVLAGLGLAQIGEFSFVLAQAGMNFQLIPDDFYNAFLASSIFTMILTPFFFKFAPVIANRFGEIEPIKKTVEDEHKLTKHVIIVGFGLNGKNLARVLKEAGIQYIVVEMNPDTFQEQKSKGERIIYGDITREEILHQTKIEDANIIVFAISDPASARRGLIQAKIMKPDIYAIVRTRFLSEIDELMSMGADEVIPEEFETSLQIFSKVLERYHIPLNVIMRQVALLRGESYTLMRAETADINSFIHLNEILAAGLTDTFYIEGDNIHINKTLSDLNLRAKTEATIIAIVRGKETLTNPSGNEVIKVGDTLVITGNHQSVDRAFQLLNGKK